MLLFAPVAVAFDPPSRAEIEAAALGAELAARGRDAARRGAWVECAADLAAAWSMDPNPRFAYEAAGCDARAGLLTEALDALEDAAASGFRDAVLLEIDADFVDLHKRPRWRRLLVGIRAAAAAREAGSNPALGALVDEAFAASRAGRSGDLPKLIHRADAEPGTTVLDNERRAQLYAIAGVRWEDMQRLAREVIEAEPNNRLARRLAAPVGSPVLLCGRDETGAGFHLYVLEGADDLDASERAWWGLPTPDEIAVGLAPAPWSWMAPP